jgi:hypothetical protein
LPKERAITLESDYSRWGLSSGRHNEVVADGPPGYHSPFASAIIHTLRNGSASFMNAAYFSEQVANRTHFNYDGQTVLGKPIPGCNDQGGQFIFWKRTYPIPQNSDNENKVETKLEPVKRAIPKLDFIDNPVSSTIPSIKTKNVSSMEQVSRFGSQISSPSHLNYMLPRHIAKEFSNWADIFLNGSTNPKWLHKQKRGDMSAMQEFLKALLKKEKNSGMHFPSGLIVTAIARLTNVKEGLAQHYRLKNIPLEEIIEKITQLYILLDDLSIQYSKMPDR